MWPGMTVCVLHVVLRAQSNDSQWVGLSGVCVACGAFITTINIGVVHVVGWRAVTANAWWLWMVHTY